MKSIFTFVSLVVALNSFSQLRMPRATQYDLLQIYTKFDLAKDKNAALLELENLYPVYKMNGKVVVSCLGKINETFSKEGLEKEGVLVGDPIGGVVSLKIPVSLLTNSSLFATHLSYLEIAAKVKPTLNLAVKDMRADSVHHGYTLNQAYTGKNVFIGVTDWGFDYTHPMFYDTLLNESRIHAAWDQYKQSGPNPSLFAYGTEYNTIPNLLAAGTDTSNIYGIHTHGSHVAGIAGGSGAGTINRGLAFEAQFLFTTFLVDNGAVLDAFAWMKQKAEAANKRLVINMSWGLYHIGSLDGNSLINQVIDNLSDQGVIFVTSAGNNGSGNFHLKKTFVNDSVSSVVGFYPYSANPYMYGQSITAWGEVGKNFKIKCKVFNTTGSSLLAQTPLFDVQATTSYVDSYILVGLDTVFYNLSADFEHPANNRSFARFRIKNTNTNYRIVLYAQALDGTVHFWNVTELSTNVGNWGQPFSANPLITGSVAGDNFYGIGDPASSKKAISVAAYASGYLNGSGNPVGGSIATFSSWGPTLDERIKPDVAAPGVNVTSSINHYTNSSYTSAGTVLFNGITYHFSKFSGTSMSGPATAGTVALMLDADSTLSAVEAKTCLQQTAREDSKTGIIPIGGSTRWGMGKVNALEAVRCAQDGTAGVSILELDEMIQFLLVPNPTSTAFKIIGNKLIENMMYELIDACGKIVKTGKINSNEMVSISGIDAGIYSLKLAGYQAAIQKLVIY